MEGIAYTSTTASTQSGNLKNLVKSLRVTKTIKYSNISLFVPL